MLSLDVKAVSWVVSALAFVGVLVTGMLWRAPRSDEAISKPVSADERVELPAEPQTLFSLAQISERTRGALDKRASATILQLPAWNVSGAIVGIDALPFEGAWSLHASSSREEEFTFDFEGSPTFTCLFPEGLWVIEARAEGFSSAALSIDIAAGEGPPSELHIALVSARRIFGRVLSTDAGPLADYPVVVRSVADGRFSSVRTDPLGWFSVEPLIDGCYSLRFGDAEHPAWRERNLELRGESLDVGVVSAPVLVDVTVSVTDENGVAIEAATIEGCGDRGGRLTGHTDSFGVFVARRVPVGHYRVTASSLVEGSVEGQVAVQDIASNLCSLRLRR